LKGELSSELLSLPSERCLTTLMRLLGSVPSPPDIESMTMGNKAEILRKERGPTSYVRGTRFLLALQAASLLQA
jgi:hypothetical protein